jgi:hypothetical protein
LAILGHPPDDTSAASSTSRQRIGAVTAIPSVRSFFHRVVTQRGGTRVRINVREHETDSNMGLGLAMGALDAPKAFDELF